MLVVKLHQYSYHLRLITLHGVSSKGLEVCRDSQSNRSRLIQEIQEKIQIQTKVAELKAFESIVN